MNAFTSKAAGNWSSAGQTTWNEVGVPGDGDTVTISHSITVDVDTTIGDDTATAAITAGGALAETTLTVAAGKMFTLKGDITAISNVLYISCSAGSTLKFYPKSGAQLTTNLNGYPFKLICNGTSGNRVTVTTDKSRGGLNTLIDAHQRGGLTTCAYTDFSHFGDATHPGLLSYLLDGGSPGTYDGPVSITNCTFNDATRHFDFDSTWDLDFTYQHNSDSNSTSLTLNGTPGICCGFTFSTGSAGTWLIDDCGFDLQVYFGTYRSRVVFTNSMAACCYITGGSWSSSNNFKNHWFFECAQDKMDWWGPVTNVFLSYSIGNPHPCHVHATGAITIDRVRLEGNIDGTTSADGDGLQLTLDNSGADITVQYCYSLPGAGEVTSCLGATAGKAKVKHCTLASNSEGGVVSIGETVDSYTAEIEYCRDNLIAAATYAVYDRSVVVGPAVDNIGSATFNAFYGAATGTNFYNTSTSQANVLGYRGVKISANTAYKNATIGANDITLSSNPLVDSTRRSETWGQIMQSTDGSKAAVVALCLTNRSLLFAAGTGMFDWVDAGFKVTGSEAQTKLNNAGSDGVTIGAMGFQASGGGGNSGDRMRRILRP